MLSSYKTSDAGRSFLRISFPPQFTHELSGLIRTRPNALPFEGLNPTNSCSKPLSVANALDSNSSMFSTSILASSSPRRLRSTSPKVANSTTTPQKLGKSRGICTAANSSLRSVDTSFNFAATTRSILAQTFRYSLLHSTCMHVSSGLVPDPMRYAPGPCPAPALASAASARPLACGVRGRLPAFGRNFVGRGFRCGHAEDFRTSFR